MKSKPSKHLPVHVETKMKASARKRDRRRASKITNASSWPRKITIIIPSTNRHKTFNTHRTPSPTIDSPSRRTYYANWKSRYWLHSRNGIISNPISKQISPRQSGEFEYQRHVRKRSDNKIGTFSQQLQFNVDETPVPTKLPISKNSFTYKYVIGKGGFGKVWRVELKKNKKEYAMKEMSKAL